MAITITDQIRYDGDVFTLNISNLLMMIMKRFISLTLYYGDDGTTTKRLRVKFYTALGVAVDLRT